MSDQDLNLMTPAGLFNDETKAREFLEAKRWPDGQVCPFCESRGVYKLTPKAGSTKPVRAGVYKCKACRKQFSVRVGTIFEDSHIPLAKWLAAIHLMTSSKKGISSHQLSRELGITLKSAWFLSHRVREAMRQEPLAGMLSGTVEVDETYVGGKPCPQNHPVAGEAPKTKRGRGTDKQPVTVLVERDGSARAMPLERVDAHTLKQAIREHVHPSSTIMTDEWSAYRGIGEEFEGGHHTVNHSEQEYVRYTDDGSEIISTNTGESSFALLKHGHYGIFHQLSKKHLHRYGDEFEVLDLTSLTVDEYTALVPPLRPHSWMTWLTGPSTGGSGKRAATPLISTVRCRPRKIGCCVSWSPSSRTPRHGCMGACSACASPRRPHGCMSSCPCGAHLAHPGRCALAPGGGRACTPGRGSTRSAAGHTIRGSGARRLTASSPPVCHDGTERPIPRPHDATAQQACDRGKQKRHMLKHLLLINQTRHILCLRETHPGRVHDKRIADTTPYPLPAGSQLLQDVGFQAFTLDGVDIIQPTQKPRGQELTRTQKAGNRQISRRRVRIEHVSSRVKRCRMLKEIIRVWKAGIRDMMMEIGGAWHNPRVRMTPSWAPLV